jgi:hypothetical protein
MAAMPAEGIRDGDGTDLADVSAFLSVFAALLLDNVLRLEETASRVTDLLMSTGRADRQLIVALQGFDRLKQEFEALGDALARYADSTNGLPAVGNGHAELGRNVIAAITVADLKDRLLLRLQDDLPVIAQPPIPEAVAAEVDVDVVF